MVADVSSEDDLVAKFSARRCCPDSFEMCDDEAMCEDRRVLQCQVGRSLLGGLGVLSGGGYSAGLGVF